jgi:hypothetical protein
MREECSSAIFIFTADEALIQRGPGGDEQEVWRPSENVVYELGAAHFGSDSLLDPLISDLQPVARCPRPTCKSRHPTHTRLAAIAAINAWNRVNATTGQITGEWVGQWITGSQPATQAA